MLTPREVKMAIAAQKIMSKVLMFLEQKRTTIRLNHISLPKMPNITTNKTTDKTNSIHDLYKKPSSKIINWYDKPLGKIFIGMITGILVFIVTLIIKHYLNLPL